MGFFCEYYAKNQLADLTAECQSDIMATDFSTQYERVLNISKIPKGGIKHYGQNHWY